MNITEKEIDQEFESIGRSVRQTLEQRDAIMDVLRGKSRCWFVGCGSSYCLAKSSASLMLLRCGIDSYAVAAGDLMLHFEKYRQLMKDSAVVFLSRSGSTTEVLEAAKLIKSKTNAVCLSLCAKSESELDGFCELNIHLPWAFDESVCQTRTVGSLYASVVAMAAIAGGNSELLSQLQALPDGSEALRKELEAQAKRAADADWDHVVILADSEVSGLMEEGALAYKEICQTNSNFYHVLDVRHGPMVMINSRTFVFALLEDMSRITADLISDVRAKGAFCVVGCPENGGTAEGIILLAMLLDGLSFF